MIPKLYIARTPDGLGFQLPTYTSQYHIGLNLQAAIGSPIKLNERERIRVPVGFAIGIPQGFCGQVVSNPDLAEKHGLIVSDSPHLLNPADREPLFVLLQNISNHQVVLHRGDVIAQLLVLPAYQISWMEVKPKFQKEKTETTEIILEEGKENEQAKNPFDSIRREKKTIRDRYHKAEEE